jgi:glycosyltransferase involved in cell wall biosynthesis
MTERTDRLLVIVNRDWFFLSHFLARTLVARQAGYQVTVICQDTGRLEALREAGLDVEPVVIPRHRPTPWGLLITSLRLRRIYRRVEPTVIWQIGLLPIVCGGFAAWSLRMRCLVNAPVGMGYVFATKTLRSAMMRSVVRLVLRWLLNPPGSRVIFENSDDLRELQALRAVRGEDVVLIRGAGVDVPDAVPEEAGGVPLVLFAARLIWEKGVGEFVEAARHLRARGVRARFVIAGGIDAENVSAIPEPQLRAWVDEGVVEWLGQRSDMPQVLARSHVFCLPTWYREGLPKVILEAMACGRPVVTTDTPGCREAVRHEDNGLLVPPRDVEALAAAIERLVGDPDLRRRLGARGRQRAEREFSTERVCAETLAVFDEVSGRERNRPAQGKAA